MNANCDNFVNCFIHCFNHVLNTQSGYYVQGYFTWYCLIQSKSYRFLHIMMCIVLNKYKWFPFMCLKNLFFLYTVYLCSTKNHCSLLIIAEHIKKKWNIHEPCSVYIEMYECYKLSKRCVDIVMHAHKNLFYWKCLH